MARQHGSDGVSQGMDEAGSGQAPKLTETTDRTKSAAPHPEKQDRLSEGMSKAGTERAAFGGKQGGRPA